ncbi:hypothetical protein A3H80_01585 [Candidatus Roizmanbacteria bacterium RIFCSPLOWO2_02_FULL_37_19]|uniref:Dockerin domain-containing protein n=1 Tax=Candidatus Roizmanbacteria bacterium RIFCSPHIGHO2_02_FULL_37_24 TaxID=1802037 RepID=A0A1F7H046_9BACT|nr:MAG: hypothetical protein A2862_04480 [Candidatus Roizmanbacteria bacterium RIFCSPHIGHO2_01_FULL_38_41]OGK24611.1 MAG: hypothetical protein A3C24_02365 [Candidatus Roizmanbacteria bacterium RIFCSPHIGHO2_02_FULL_37_24]OGK32249.1 MAG: hypothetical protein A3E10_02305 [Candidatus Roizmanbacteria bacterium RIFCSPHIGHO2_12_FULL_37_23]OGK45543.1 MAG: hypothetical protein A2956_03075 [Candidatus Roizmanbacteria bacterium RIFCSPLOWO2_01_FULL_37_57]OGK53882.1 MAG: hypothetical protein A3H80_01585 [Ca
MRLHTTNSRKGEIATSLTFLALFVITLGVFIGSSLVTNPSQQTTETQAFAPEGITDLGNRHINVTYEGTPRRRDINPRHDIVSGTLCFNTVTPPQYGIYQIETILETQSGQEYKIGSAMEERITSHPNIYECSSPNSRPRPFSAIYWNNLTDISDKVASASISFADVKEIRLQMAIKQGTWGYRSEEIPVKFATLNKALFVATTPGPTSTPSATPTTGPAQPADVEAKVTINGELKQGFNKFDYIIETCNLKADGTINISDCGKGDNKSTGNISASGPFPYNSSHTLNGVGGGERGIVLFYGYYTADGKKDVTGVVVNRESGQCSGVLINPVGGDFRCKITVNGQKIVQEFNITLPDKNARTFELFYGKETDAKRLLQNCSMTADTLNSSKNSASSPCSAQFADNTITLNYTNTSASSSAEKIYWQLRRCNGKLDQNFEHCIRNQTAQGIDIDNEFQEASSSAIQPRQVRTCTFKLSDFPANETEENIRNLFTNKCTTATPSNTPTPSPSPTGTAVVESYYATFAIYNNTRKSISTVKVKTCYGTAPCTTESINASIKSTQRGVVEYEMKLPSGVTSYKVGCSIIYQGESQDIACPDEVSTTIKQNIIYKMVAHENSLTGGGFTELQASDVNSDGCTNGSDFSEVTNQYAFEVPPTVVNKGDINGDGIINSLDIIYTLENLNKGDSCAFNQ